MKPLMEPLGRSLVPLGLLAVGPVLSIDIVADRVAQQPVS